MTFTIFVLTRESADYDEARQMVVVASDEYHARLLASDAAWDEGKAPWRDPALSTCEAIGVANPDRKPGVECVDRNEG